MLKTLKLFMMVLIYFTLMSCTSGPKTESMGEYLDSAAITAKVKARLLDNLNTEGLGILVKTYKDEVQLSGFVNSPLVKRHAGMVAAHTAGVKRVRNHLIIKDS